MPWRCVRFGGLSAGGAAFIVATAGQTGRRWSTSRAFWAEDAEASGQVNGSHTPAGSKKVRRNRSKGDKVRASARGRAGTDVPGEVIILCDPEVAIHGGGFGANNRGPRQTCGELTAFWGCDRLVPVGNLKSFGRPSPRSPSRARWRGARAAVGVHRDGLVRPLEGRRVGGVVGVKADVAVLALEPDFSTQAAIIRSFASPYAFSPSIRERRRSSRPITDPVPITSSKPSRSAMASA